MKAVGAGLMIVLIGVVSVRCGAEVPGRRLSCGVTVWPNTRFNGRFDDDDNPQRRGYYSSPGRGFGSDPDSDAFQSLVEVNRLCQEAEFEDNPILAKALLATPLLRRGNVFMLAIRPQRDIYVTLVKRLMLRGVGKRPQVLPADGMTAIDTHVHTCHSPDSLAAVSEMLTAAARRGLNGVAITDHNSFDGAREAMRTVRTLIRRGKVPPTFFVIPGEEVSSSDGHIIGIFLTEEIPSGKSAEWTVNEIHRQGGIAIAAHPLLPHSLGELANTLKFDAVETENAAEKLHYALAARGARKQRAQFYDTVTKPRIGSSDAHDPQAVAECYTLVKCEPNPESVRAAILRGDVSPVAVPDAGERAMVGHGLPHLLAFVESASDLSPWIRRVTHSNNFDMRVLPRPAIFYSNGF